VDSPALREDSLSVRKGILTTPRLNPTKPGFIIEKPSGKKYNQRMKQIAESDPKGKDVMVKIFINILS